MKVYEVTPEVDAHALLLGAGFGDAFRIRVEGTTLAARQAAEKIFARSPRWVEALIKLRNLIVAPFGLKTSGAGEPGTRGTIGLFPVLSETADRLVLGFDDSHLDFRVIVDVAPAGNGQEVTTTTLVRTHNLLGRVYLTIILPFHRLIARAIMRQVAA